MTSSNDTEALARRLVACPHFGWIPGMLDMLGQRITEEIIADALDYASPLPDLDDPATRGCVLQLVRDAWGDPCICMLGLRPDMWVARGSSWWPDRTGPMCNIDSASEAEALVAALEAAPREAGR